MSTFGLGVRAQRLGGLFPYQNAEINWNHPLAANLIFFAVPVPSGYFDLVARQPMPHQAPTSAPGNTPRITLFTHTPLGMAAWAYGAGTINPLGVYAVTPGLQPRYQPASAFTVGCGIWSFDYAAGYNGTTNRFVSATSGTDNTGVLTIEAVNNATALVGGGGSTANVADGTLNINNSHTTHGILAAYNGSTLCVQRDGGLGGASLSTSHAWSGINQIRIGDPTVNSSGRPIFWAAAWNVALVTSGAATTLSKMATNSGDPETGVSRAQAWGDVPRGLLIRRPH